MDQQNGSSTLHYQAIDAALDCCWDKAILLNRQIIKTEPENVDALNRLAHAYFELNNTNLAKKYYCEVLKFDPYNPIASKNLKIIEAFKKDGNGHDKPINTLNHIRVSPALFLQEPGKTKAVSLLKIAEPQKLSHTFCGMPVQMLIKNRGITILDPSGVYLGVLPDDIAHQLLRLTKGGNKYEAFIKSVKVNGLSILIRETFRASKFRNQPSFLEYSILSQPTEMIANLHQDGEETPPTEEELEE